MTNQQHPIIPPKDLLQQLRHNTGTWLDQITIAYQAGADQELEACVEWLEQNCGRWDLPAALRAARRPQPPSLKEQALKMLRPLSNPVMPGTPEYRLYEPQAEIIRRALEALDD